MAVYVKRFSVKRNGKVYGPGDTIRDISSDEEKKLVEDSGGALVLIENSGGDAAKSIPPINPPKAVKGTKK